MGHGGAAAHGRRSPAAATSRRRGGRGTPSCRVLPLTLATASARSLLAGTGATSANRLIECQHSLADQTNLLAETQRHLQQVEGAYEECAKQFGR